MVQACNFRIQETEAGRSWVQGQSRLHSEFEASLGFSLGFVERSCVNQNIENITKTNENEEQKQEFKIDVNLDFLFLKTTEANSISVL